MGFQTPQYELAELLRRAADGRIQLPDFQRGYKWDEERIRSLLVTVTLGHPMGAIMLLATGNDQVRFKPKPLEGTPAALADVAPDLLLLDGQQRLTSLYQALTGDGVVDTTDVRNKKVQRRFYLRMDLALGDPASRDEAVVALPADGIVRTNFGKDIVLDVSTPELEREHGYFPIRLVFDNSEGTGWLFSYPDHAAAQQFFAQIRTPMLSYQIPAIELDRATTKSAVATVFEKVNTGGLPLNVFELMTATFAGDAAYFQEHGTDFRLNDDWALTQEVLHEHPVVAGLENTAFLQAVALLATNTSAGATSARKGDILRLDLRDYLAWAPQVREALVWSAQFLDAEHIHTRADVPYPTQIVPLAAIRVLLGSDADLHGVRARLRQWFWCGVLGEKYGSAAETQFVRDVDQVPEWARAAVTGKEAPVPTTVSSAVFFESRLLSLRTRASGAYKGIHALLMATGAKDWSANLPFDKAHYLNLAVDIHHIFPQKWCRAQGIDKALMDSIVNKTPLAAATNRFVQGDAPSHYLPRLQSRSGQSATELDAVVGVHLIDTDHLRADDFDAFFKARRQALLELVEQAMGQPAQHDVRADQISGGEEAPDAFEEEPPEEQSDADSVAFEDEDEDEDIDLDVNGTDVNLGEVNGSGAENTDIDGDKTDGNK